MVSGCGRPRPRPPRGRYPPRADFELLGQKIDLCALDSATLLQTELYTWLAAVTWGHRGIQTDLRDDVILPIGSYLL